MAHPLFRLDGRYYGFVADGYIFDAAGSYRGWVSRGQVWRADGRYVGELRDRRYVVRGVYATMPADRSPLTPPPRPRVPNPWADIPPQTPSADYDDAIEGLTA
jgi:hypothetical protein